MNIRMLRRAVLAGGIAVLAVVSFGNPHRHVADILWPDDAAPWEHVTAVYVPDVGQPTRVKISEATFDDLAACRDHIMEQAAAQGDPNLEKGRFECAIGFYADKDDGTGGEYRLIIK
ncbi:MAG: hypothetical protein JJ871_06730 [Thalassospira sp.]|uniref:hypothetical protein n=1 Tax=Thalassospira sp. TaxID=1912094 RepID=UPI001B2EEC8E|nr:hypothetical protein [Thalassospira sp.]MBO6578579.1 hypothetical protein [Thalassospira sp.]MBO6802449.1 hypothetical protein [Thalassospira sp.]MBO6818810.1 hypothetical protein [Thalassospira sp.]MBO6887744.1 hypothetical protein [Thalassospira sp.]